MKQETKGNYAFISYSHKDKNVARRIQKILETFKLPTAIRNEFCESKYLRPIFRDETDIEPGVLGERLRNHLNNSKFLIVICSSESVKSKYVNEEVRYFIEDLGRYRYVIPVIVEKGNITTNVTDLFPLFLREHIEEQPQDELLAANVTQDGLQKASVRIISRMLGIKFDTLWNRYQNTRRKKIFFSTIATLFIVSVIAYLAVPVTSNIKISIEKWPLPSPKNCVVCVNGVDYQIGTLDSSKTVVVKNIPGYFRGREMTCVFKGDYCMTDTFTLKMGLGVINMQSIKIRRDSTFAVFAGQVIDGTNGCPISKATVTIENLSCETDTKGCFYISFPIERQSTTKRIVIHHPLYKDYSRNDECPNSSLGYILLPRSNS